MKPLLSLLAIALLGLSACAGTGAPVASSGSRTSATKDYDNDKDIDSDPRHDNDLYFGHAAAAAEVDAATATVKRYYAAAAADRGESACAELATHIAAEIPTTYGSPAAGSPGLSGGTCAILLSKLFARRHRQLVADNAALTITGMLVEGTRGLVLLRFGAPAQRHLFVERERGAWKLDSLLANLPPQ